MREDALFNELIQQLISFIIKFSFREFIQVRYQNKFKWMLYEYNKGCDNCCVPAFDEYYIYNDNLQIIREFINVDK